MNFNSNGTIVQFRDGLHGTIEAGALATDNASIPVQLADGRRVLIARNILQPQADGSYSVPLGMEALAPVNFSVTTPERTAENVLILPVMTEELRVEKRAVEIGRARLTKTIHEREEVVDEPLMREEVAIEYKPIQQVVDGPLPNIRYEGDTMIVPLLEEVLVIEKRLMLKEELHIRRVQRTVHEPQTVTLRSEDITVERVEPQGASETHEARPTA